MKRVEKEKGERGLGRRLGIRALLRGESQKSERFKMKRVGGGVRGSSPAQLLLPLAVTDPLSLLNNPPFLHHLLLPLDTIPFPP